jgi:RNA polymerase sigma-70 factor (ECF subfamily)
MADEDAALVEQVRGGSERAFNLLIDRHQQAVRSFLRRLLANVDEAEDIAQETFLAAWEGARHFRGGSSVRSWLCAIAWRKAKSAQRGWVRSRRREASWHAQSLIEGEAPSSAEDRLAVKQALLSLPFEQRAVAALCLAEGFSHTEAAEALGAPLGTVKTHVARAKERLLQALSEIPPPIHGSMEHGR